MRLCNIPIILLFFVMSGCVKQDQGNKLINGNMEQLDSLHNPAGWNIPHINKLNTYYYDALDSNIQENGKYSISIENKVIGEKFGTIVRAVNKTFQGQEIEFRGYIKTKDVSNGYAGLWMRLDNGTTPLALDNMQNRGITGTTDWTEYIIKLPYDDDKTTSIVFGAILAGRGKVWIDNLRIFIDGKPLDDAKLKTIKLPNAKTDTAFQKKSSVDILRLSSQRITNLTLLCQVWGFMKYHHPAITAGDFNMDAELFRILPLVIASRNNAELSDNIENWVSKFGTPELCITCQIDTSNVSQIPNYGTIFKENVLKPSLVKKLKYILDNRNHSEPLSNNSNENNYYASTIYGTGNLSYKNEISYAKMQYPDAGYRLLCLFRYWNIIQYFYPYKNLTGSDWNKILPEYIPRFVNAANKTDYALTTLALIAEVHDTHANIWSQSVALNDYIGHYLFPLFAKFVQNKLVVTGYLSDSISNCRLVKPGDVITHINGKSVNELVKKNLPITPASNYSTQLRDLPMHYLLRSHEKSGQIEIISNGIKKTLNLINVDAKNLNNKDRTANIKEYTILPGKIGYLYPAKYKNADLPTIETLFKYTKGIIIDMRCYPSDFMPYTFVPFIKSGDKPFVLISYPDIYNPGLFKLGQPIGNNGENNYRGKIVVIVNEVTQSQAEYTTMAFQSSPNVTVIGSTTAGADGNVETIALPGGFSTLISGLDICYPDGTETQRKGVKIDYFVTPTIKGIKQGRDELLEKAKAIIIVKH
jgi:hypothetical protein